MSQRAVEPPYDQFLATGEEVIRERPEVDPELTREIFLEVATMLDNGLALDGLDEHDAAAAVAEALPRPGHRRPGGSDPRRSRATEEDRGDLHDPESVARAYLIAAAMMQL